MANRVLRDTTSSDSIDSLSPGAEVFFYRLIMKADDYGSYHANPKLLKAALFPLKEYSQSEINNWINECTKAGLTFCYIVDGKEYIRIDNFGQRLRNMRNTFPQPADNSLTNGRDSRPETKRNEVETKRREEPPKGFSDDFYKSVPEAFEEIKNDELQIENLMRIVRNSGFRACNEVTIVLAVKHFFTVEGAKPGFMNRPRDEIKQHLVNWTNKNAKTIDQYAR